MSRPRRGTEAVFYDTFADWPLTDQAAALKVLEALHRQKQRDGRREKPVEPEPIEQSDSFEQFKRGSGERR